MNELNQPFSRPTDDELDALLARASWPAAPLESTARLRARWNGLATGRWRFGSLARGAMSAAAVIAVVSGSVWMIVAHPRSKPPVPVVENAKPPALYAALPRGDTPAALRHVVGRAPTIFELAMIRRAQRERSPAIVAGRHPHLSAPPIVVKIKPASLANPQALADAARRSTDPQQRRALIAEIFDRPESMLGSALPVYLSMIVDDQTKADALAALDGVRHPPTDQLLATLRSPRFDFRNAAALALGRIDGPITTKKLIEMIARNRSQREAFLALACSRGKEAQAFVHQAAANEQFASYALSAMAQTEIR